MTNCPFLHCMKSIIWQNQKQSKGLKKLVSKGPPDKDLAGLTRDLSCSASTMKRGEVGEEI